MSETERLKALGVKWACNTSIFLDSSWKHFLGRHHRSTRVLTLSPFGKVNRLDRILVSNFSSCFIFRTCSLPSTPHPCCIRPLPLHTPGSSTFTSAATPPWHSCCQHSFTDSLTPFTLLTLVQHLLLTACVKQHSNNNRPVSARVPATRRALLASFHLDH